jgi:hypothetical protein
VRGFNKLCPLTEFYPSHPVPFPFPEVLNGKEIEISDKIT